MKKEPTILSDLDLRRFDDQISNEAIGIVGQETLRYSPVVVQGLCGIGIAAMRCLLAAGVGEVIVIDDKEITAKMLPSQTLFGLDDIGKLRCIAAREKQMGGTLDDSLKLYNTQLNETNIDRLIGNAKIIIKTSWETEFDSNMFDMIDSRDLYLIGAFGREWRGVFGTYSQEKKDRFRELYTNLYLQNKNSFNEDSNCFSFVSNFIGAAIASAAIKILLNLESFIDSTFYKVDLFNPQLIKIL